MVLTTPKQKPWRHKPMVSVIRFHKMAWQVSTFRKTLCRHGGITKHLDEWVRYYNNRANQSKVVSRTKELEALLDGKSTWAERN